MPRHLALAVAAVLVAAPAAAQQPNFGAALATSGDELLVGQPANWYGPGTVYTYRRDAAGQWQETGRFTAPDTARMDSFGATLAADGDLLLVAAPEKHEGAGKVYALTRTAPGAAWRHAGVLEAPAGGGFGSAMVLSGADAFIG